MGTYIRYKLRNAVEASPEKINDWLNTQPEQKALNSLEHAQQVHFWDRQDQEWWDNECAGDYYLDIGEGDLKASCTPSEGKDLWAMLFEKLHTEYDIAILSSSCAMTLDHLTHRQLKKISDNGDALSGTDSEQLRIEKLLTNHNTQ
jgi:hypothetical protein